MARFDLWRARATLRQGARAFVSAAVLAGGPRHVLLAQGPPAALPTIEQKTAGMVHIPGYLPLYWEEASGNLFLEVGRWGEEFLYQVSLSTGLGSNPVGLDRGQLGGTYVLRAERVGPTVLLVEPNYRFRARTDDAAEVRAVEEAFALSTHWGFTAVARTGDRVLVNATPFLLRDAHGVTERLRQTHQGSFHLDGSRSVVHLPRTRGFPRNTEVETQLTFTSDVPGPLVVGTAATGNAVTMRQHHSFVQLPDPGYTPRVADPRVSSFGITFNDYALPIDERLTVTWISRHRLQKRNPNAGRSEPERPIVYYVDPGTPEPIRSALIEGGNWWSEAFEAAGFINAFRVEVLPEGADPMDVRYNMIHWTHRSTRGWSYGNAVRDPRTGEIIKGNVNLGSLRLRQDHLLALGLGAPADPPPPPPPPPGGEGSSPGGGTWFCSFAGGPTFGYLGVLADQSDPVDLALARVRQLSAHEIGHTLGFAHNYIASTYGRASVMDYPAPLVRIADGRLDLTDAYAVGIGEWDKFTVNWAYREFPPGSDEPAALADIVREGLARGMRFISDADARPAGAAHPLAALWDNGSDPLATLRHEIEVRRLGLDLFGERALRAGDPLARLEEVLVPLYLHHRYQLEAAAHSLGGADYTYAVRGDGQIPVALVPPATQRAALAAMLETLSPQFLALPEHILQRLPPRAFGVAGGEIFGAQTGPLFDALGAAASAVDLTVGFILQPERMARLVDFHSRDARYPGLAEVVDTLLDATWGRSISHTLREAEYQRIAQRVVLDRLLESAAGDHNPPRVRAILAFALAALKERIQGAGPKDPHQQLALADLERWERRPYAGPGSATPELPPGSPIGKSPPHRW